MLNRVIGDYGGPYKDYATVEDPQSDVSAANLNRMAEDVAQGSRTAVRVIVRFQGHASSPTLTEAMSVWGTGSGQNPTVARTGTGVYTLTWATTYTDANDVTETVSLKGGVGGLESSGTWGHVNVKATSANVLTVYCANASGVANDLAGETIVVFGR